MPDPAPIVPYPNHVQPVRRTLDGDAAGAGVERVLEQLLDDGARVCDDLGAAEEAGGGLGEALDRH